MSNSWEKIAQRISERTGLKTKEEVEAYAHFCMHSDFKNGVILYGDVQHEFYEVLSMNASAPMRMLERVYHDAVGNRVHEDLNGQTAQLSDESERRLHSPLVRVAKEEYGKYYKQFVEMRLISLPESSGKGFSAEYYPKLRGYNYFNDPEFYRAEGNGRTSIV